MVPFVFFLGVIAILAGGVAIAFGIPINEFGLGNTLILAGTTAVSAGFIVLALGAVLRAIERGNRELPAMEDESAAPPAERAGGAAEWPRPAPVAPMRPEVPQRERAEATPPARPAWSESREESAREGMRPPAPRPAAPPLRAERGPAPGRAPLRAERPREPVVEPPRLGEVASRAPEPSHAGEPGVVGPAGEGAGEPSAPATSPERRRLFAWTRRSAGREASEQAAESRAEPNLGEGGPRGEAPRFAARGEERREPARPAAERPPAAREAQPGPEDEVQVLKSGTVGGMSYTLYTDGSIDAEFPDGKLRFASIEDLRRHLEEQG